MVGHDKMQRRAREWHMATRGGTPRSGMRRGGARPGNARGPSARRLRLQCRKRSGFFYFYIFYFHFLQKYIFVFEIYRNIPRLPGGRDVATRQPGGRGYSAKNIDKKLRRGP
jgi:hypothetical protein